MERELERSVHGKAQDSLRPMTVDLGLSVGHLLPVAKARRSNGDVVLGEVVKKTPTATAKNVVFGTATPILGAYPKQSVTQSKPLLLGQLSQVQSLFFE